MRILAFAASLRRASLNRKLVALAADVARTAGAEVDVAEFRQFELPIYDGDADERSGLPPGGLELKRRLEDADAVMIAAPEYNYSIAGPLKNAIDWVSRARPRAFDESGRLRDPALAARLQREVVGFVRLAEAVAAVWGQRVSAPARKRRDEIASALEDESQLQPAPE